MWDKKKPETAASCGPGRDGVARSSLHVKGDITGTEIC